MEGKDFKGNKGDRRIPSLPFGASISKMGYVNREIKQGLDVADMQPKGRIYVVPVRLEDCPVPSELEEIQWVDYFKPNGTKSFSNPWMPSQIG
jgi:hypothetical protein